MRTVGLIGSFDAGCDQVFEAAVGGHAHEWRRGRVTVREGVLDIPDDRLTKLASTLGSERVVPANVVLWHYPNDALQAGSTTETEWVGELRTVDVLLWVVRTTSESNLAGAIDANLRAISSELALYDLAVLDSSISRAQERLVRGPRSERRDVEAQLVAMQQVHNDLEEGATQGNSNRPGCKHEALRGLALLTAKPKAIAINASDEVVSHAQAWASTQTPHGVCIVAGDTESALHELNTHDAESFRDDLGFASPAATRVASTVLDAADLTIFYTGNKKATTAWLLRRGASAVEAAGTVHSDMATRFIRVDVVEADHLINAGGIAAARDSGFLRQEGRDYTINKSDLILVHFSR